MPITERALSFKLQIGKGSFGESGFDTVDLAGHRATATVSKLGTPDMNRATIRIFGLTASIMQEVSRIGLIPEAVRDNLVTITAGSGGQDMALVFAGGIQEAWQDFAGMPDVAFNMVCHTGYFAQLKKIAPSSYPGSTSVKTIMADLAAKMGYTLEDNGVTAKLASPYLPGTARMQALAAAEAANIYVVFDDDRHTMAILPVNGTRAGASPLISPETGLVGYPSYIGAGKISLRTIFNPAIRFMGSVNVQSSLTQANGQWRVYSLTHHLESQTPNGQWFSEIMGNNYENTSARKNEQQPQ